MPVPTVLIKRGGLPWEGEPFRSVEYHADVAGEYNAASASEEQLVQLSLQNSGLARHMAELFLRQQRFKQLAGLGKLLLCVLLAGSKIIVLSLYLCEYVLLSV